MTPAGLGAGLAVALAVFVVMELLALRADRPHRRDRARRDSAVLAVLTRLGRRLGVAPAPEALAGRLAAAGVSPSTTPTDVMAAKTGAALLVLVVTLGPATALPGRLGPLLAIALPVAAASAPELWLRRRARVRARAMAAEAADVLDLLRVCVEAGRPPSAALAEVGARHRGLLGTELRRVARERELGRPGGEILGELAARCPIPELQALTAALRRADRHGAPLAPALQALAADARAARARAVREQAARAAPKIQLVVALLLVPAVMLLIGAALASAFLT